MPDDYDRGDYIRPSEVAKMWGVSASAVRKLIKTGKLPALRTPTGRLLVKRSDANLRPARGQ